ncbi:hypothetical protein Tco_1374177 [Tanacetum coccineum]
MTNLRPRSIVHLYSIVSLSLIFLLAISPSFKLLDEDLDEVIKLTVLAAGDPLVKINSDVCKIITERTVFYHIREKAKSLPSLAPKSTTKYLEYKEALNLIRKRTHERQLALNDNTKSLKLIDDSNPYAKSNILQKENVLIIDSDAVKPQLKAATQEKQHKSPGNLALYRRLRIYIRHYVFQASFS